MSRNSIPKSTAASILLISICSLLVLTLMLGCTESEKENEQTVGMASSAPGRIQENTLSIDVARQQRSGIIAETLEPVSHQRELRAFGTVLELQRLLTLRNDYVSAKARMEKALTELSVSQKQYERSRALNAEGKNISDKDLQTARAAWQSSDIDVRSSEEALHVLEDTSRQQWGDVITWWLVNSSPAIDRLMRQRDLLIQITLPPDAKISEPPRSAWIITPEENRASASLVSLSPRTDPRIQGMSYFYLIATDTKKLLPGMNIAAYLPSGPEVKGVVIPSSAVVWWQGSAWVYVQKETVHFVRREVSTANHVKDGYFVTEGFEEGDSIAVKGAQLLLSEEFRAQLQGREKD